MTHRIVTLPGDGIGPEILAPALEVLSAVGEFEFEEHLFGGASIDAYGVALTDEVLAACRKAERRRRIAERDCGASQLSDQDPEGALPVLILERWLETLSHQERTEHHLGRYLLGAGFVRSAEALSQVVRDHLAFER